MITVRPGLRQSQSLALTPRLLQSIALLQYNNLQLAGHLAAAVESNPLLELAETAPEPQSAVGANGAGMRDRPAPSVRGPQMAAGLDPAIAESLAAVPTLREHLRSQMPIGLRDPVETAIAEEIIDSLDENGYLRREAEDIAASLKATVSQVLCVLKIVQSFDPAGIAARDLAECLAIQLAEISLLDAPMRTLLEHLDLVARRDHAKLAQLCGVDTGRIAAMVAAIRSLNPRPGAQFDAGPVCYALPDLFVRRNGDDGWIVELNSATLPRLLVNRDYLAQVPEGCAGARERAFLAEKLEDANWLVRSLDQRARTILSVATEIVRRQGDFLRHGVAHLKPMTLRMVAQSVGMHESTISRAVAGKFIQTERGLFELRYFFSGGQEAEHSPEAVRHHIRKLIEAERPDHILSDDAIVALLRAEGMDVARRTVAKYRESMAIPSSVQRRREKRGTAAHTC